VPTLTVADIGERALIARIKARVSMPSWVVIGPGDDAAVIQPERGTFDVLTTDAQVEGVHFDRRFVPPDAIGHRALAVNLSDLAAMGATPRAALLSLALPPALDVSDFEQIVDGVLAFAAAHRTTLVGGNITQTSGPLIVDVTAIGSAKPRRILTRSGARPGDEVYVTGSLGEAAIGLRRLQAAARSALAAPSRDSARDGPERVEGPKPGEGGPPNSCVIRYLRPQPRVRAGMLLGRNRAASSCMDVSDGLADCARQVAEASGVGITLDAAAIPVSAEVREAQGGRGLDPLEPALSGGEDYELFFTVRPAHRGRLRTVCQQLGDLPITRIGVVTKGRDLLLRDEDGTRPLPAGYEHFRVRPS
jgi:thiamine-monophosphate kinase